MQQLVVIHDATVYAVPHDGSYTYAVSTTLILDAPAAGTLNIQKVGSDPIAITKGSFQAGRNAINVAVSRTPESSGALTGQAVGDWLMLLGFPSVEHCPLAPRGQNLNSGHTFCP